MKTGARKITNAAPPAAKATTSAGGSNLVRRLSSLNKWREQYNPLLGLSASRVVELGRDYFLGSQSDIQWVYFYIEQTDPDLFALIDRRTSRLLEMDYSIKIAKDTDKPLATAQQQFLQEKFEKIDNLYEAIEHLALADFRGFAHCEKWFEGGELTHLEVVDQWNTVRDGLRGEFKYNPEAKQTLFSGLPDDALMPGDNFLFREVRRPINRIALFKFFWSAMTEKDWTAFNQIYSLPGGVVTGPPDVPVEKVAEYEAAAQIIAEGGSGFLPHGSTWTPNTGPRGISPFKERLDYLTEKLILVGTGGMLTMLTKSGSGTLAGNAHTDSFEQIAKGSARKISETFNRQLTKAWLDEAFPGQKHSAYFALSANEETKIGEVIDHVQKLRAAGFQCDMAEVSERTGYTLTLAPSPAAGASGGAGGLDGKSSDPATGDPESIANRIRNRAFDAGAAVLRSNSLRLLSAAESTAVQPMLDRIDALKELPADGLAAALTQLRADLPRLQAEARLQAPDIAAIWEQVLGTALVDGLADSPDAAPIENKAPARKTAPSARKSAKNAASSTLTQA